MSEGQLEKQVSDDLKLQKRWFTFLFSKKVPPIPSDDERKEFPQKKANWISQLMFFWMYPILNVGYKRTLQYEDCFKLDEPQTVDHLYKKFQTKLSKLILKNKSKVKQKTEDEDKITKLMILNSLYHTLFFEFWIAIIFKIMSDTASAVSPLLLKKLTNFVEYATNGSNVYYGKGGGYAVGATLLIFFNSVTLNYSFYHASVVASKTRVILTRALLEKTFKIDSKGLHKFPLSSINIIMSTDLSRLDIGILFIIIVLSTPVPVAISIALLIVNLGVSALAGIGCFLCTFLVLGFSFKKLVSLRGKATKYTDIRVSLTKEFLKNFKMIKLYSWENSYNKRIEDARNMEMKYTLTMQTIKNILTSLTFALPNIAAMVAFLTASRVSPNKNAGNIFSSLSLFQGLSVAFFTLPMAIGGLANVKVAFQKVSEFLSCHDIQLKDYETKILNDEKIALKVNNADFEWDNFDDNVDNNGTENKKLESNDDNSDYNSDIIGIESKKSINISFTGVPTEKKSSFVGIKNINLKIYKGEFVIVAGPIGSGKSSLLYAFAGLMKHPKGDIYVNGEYILCAKPWIKNDSIRNNITFGLPYDKIKYNEIVKACCLNDDFDQFIGGDLTEVGERGITLSGGQKARISLARSVYADTPILYLDDVLSAVDAKVGKHIVEHCICGLLKNRTVILATHHIDLVDKADRVIFLEGDGSLAIGKIDELKSRYPKIKEFFQTNFNAIKDEEKDDEDNETDNLENPNLNVVSELKTDSKMVRIIGDEEKNVNGLSFNVYKSYYKLGVGFFGFMFLPLFFILVVLATFSTYFSNVWLAYWIEKHFKNRSYGFYAGLYILFNFTYTILSALEFILLSYFCVTASKYLNLNAIKKVLHAPVVFMDVSPLGRVLNRFTKDTDVLDNEIVDQMRMAVYPISMMVGTFILCIIYLPWFAIAVPLLLFAYVFIICYYQASSRELKRIEAIRRSFVFTHFNESLEGLETIKAYKMEPEFMNKLNKLLDQNNEVYFLTWAIQRWIGGSFAIVNIFFILVISLLCCFRIFNINSESTGLLLNYSFSIPSYLSLAVRCLAQVETEFNSVERLNFYSKELIQEPDYEKPEIDNKLINWPCNGRIKFSNVKLKYRPELPYVLKNLNLEINANERIGFCGRTGAGKSTFMTCLYRIVEFEGSILIDDINIKEIGLHKLRSSITIIPQDPVLFFGNIRNNLDPFNEYDDNQLWDALVISGLISKDELNNIKNQTKADDNYHKFHLNRNVEDDGNNFSLGERQLIALARALVRKTKILILDEATSSVDYITDNKIQKTISTHFKNCTILSIAHRLKTIISFDRIIVMDNGEVVQFDKPYNLFNDKDGLFRKLCDQSGIVENDFV